MNANVPPPYERDDFRRNSDATSSTEGSTSMEEDNSVRGLLENMFIRR